MKTLKFAMIAALVACTMVSLASAEGFKIKPKKALNLTYEKAIQNPGLVAAMYQQLDAEDFVNNTQHYLVAEVIYNETLYRITGTLGQWIRFFSWKWNSPVKTNLPVMGVN
jgi:hypothetical protein